MNRSFEQFIGDPKDGHEDFHPVRMMSDVFLGRDGMDGDPAKLCLQILFVRFSLWFRYHHIHRFTLSRRNFPKGNRGCWKNFRPACAEPLRRRQGGTFNRFAAPPSSK
jgi:hypothetical protein